MLTIEPPAAADFIDLAEGIHPNDRAELAAAGVTVQMLAAHPVGHRSARWNGRLFALFGMVGHPLDEGAGIPWMLCTRLIDSVPRGAVAVAAQRIVESWKTERSMLVNQVHIRNKRAHRFIEWLGFTIDRTPTGPDGEFFVFTWSRN